MDITESKESNNELKWQCTVCTLFNSDADTLCEACGTSKEGNTDNSTALWKCNVCTTYNRVGNTVCQTCGSSVNTYITILGTNPEGLEESDVMSDSTRDIMDQLGLIPYNPPQTPRQQAENIVFNNNPCRCMTCRLRAMSRVIMFSESASTDEQRYLAGIMINEILPELIMTTFNQDNPIIQLLGSGSLESLQNVLDRSLAEAECRQRPATEEDMQCIQDIKINEEQLTRQDKCVICMDSLNNDSHESMDIDNDEDNNENTTSEKIISQLPCGHIFHKDCLIHWLEQDASCPICKLRIDKEVGLIDEQSNAISVDIDDL